MKKYPLNIIILDIFFNYNIYMISQLLRKKYPRKLFFFKTNQNIDKKILQKMENSKIILPKSKFYSIPWKHTQSNLLFIDIPYDTYIKTH